MFLKVLTTVKIVKFLKFIIDITRISENRKLIWSSSWKWNVMKYWNVWINFKKIFSILDILSYLNEFNALI